MSDTETEKVEVVIMKETDKAYMLKNLNGDMSWFPKSEVSFNSRIKDNATAEIPLWLLNKNAW